MKSDARPVEVVKLQGFDKRAERAGLTESDIEDIAAALSLTPRLGAVMKGTGGVRKFRWAVGGKGKSGGARVISYYPGRQSVFLITAFGKKDQDNLTGAQKNEMKKLTAEVDKGARQ